MAETFRFPGTVALVTGAASGIGAALATALAERGCALALVDRDAEGLARVADPLERDGIAVSRHAFDLADAEAIRALPEVIEARHGRLDLLVNNAGVALGGRFAETHLDDFEWLMDVNLRAVVRMCHAFLPMLERAPIGQIVNMSSLFGLIAPPGQVAYATSKFGVRGFSEALRHEYAGTALGVSVVHPGGVATAIARNSRGPRPTGDAEAMEAARLAFAAGQATFESYLQLKPEAAAAEIGRGIERRSPRIIVGTDARRAALIQRLMPTGYWALIQRLSAKKR